LDKKVALVTGASRGIGAACALRLGMQGYRVCVHYRGEKERAHEIAKQIPESLAVKFDLEEKDAAQELVALIKTEFGQLDVLVNNAGISIDQVLPFAKPEDFDRLIAVNLRPVFVLSKLCGKLMMRRKSGRIINLTSVVGHTGNAGQSMYSTTKAAITGFSKSIAHDLAPFGVLVNCVAPGFIKTDMTDALTEEVKEQILTKIPLKRLGTVDEVANAVAFLVSDQANYITGTTIHVNGGMFTS
jgi:3-oxoacyl-[acyl-carrier protein] reductase